MCGDSEGTGAASGRHFSSCLHIAPSTVNQVAKVTLWKNLATLFHISIYVIVLDSTISSIQNVVDRFSNPFESGELK